MLYCIWNGISSVRPQWNAAKGKASLATLIPRQQDNTPAGKPFHALVESPGVQKGKRAFSASGAAAAAANIARADSIMPADASFGGTVT